MNYQVVPVKAKEPVLGGDDGAAAEIAKFNEGKHPPVGYFSSTSKIAAISVLLLLGVAAGLVFGIKQPWQCALRGTCHSSNDGDDSSLLDSISIPVYFLSTSESDSTRRRLTMNSESIVYEHSPEVSIEAYIKEIRICSQNCDENGLCVQKHCIEIRSNPLALTGNSGQLTYTEAIADTDSAHYVDITDPMATKRLLQNFTVSIAEVGNYTYGNVGLDDYVRVKAAVPVPTEQDGIYTMYTKAGNHTLMYNSGGDGGTWYNGTLTHDNMTSNTPSQRAVFTSSSDNTFEFLTPFIVSEKDFIRTTHTYYNASSGTYFSNYTYAATLRVMLAYDTDYLLAGYPGCSAFCGLKDHTGLGLIMNPPDITPVVFHSNEEVWKETYFYNATSNYTCATASNVLDCMKRVNHWIGRISVYYTAAVGSIDGGAVLDKSPAAAHRSGLITTESTSFPEMLEPINTVQRMSSDANNVSYTAFYLQTYYGVNSGLHIGHTVVSHFRFLLNLNDQQIVTLHHPSYDSSGLLIGDIQENVVVWLQERKLVETSIA